MAELTRKLCDGATCDSEGSIVSVVAKLGVVDDDRDVTLPDAIHSGTDVVLSAFGHSAVLSHAKGTGMPVEAPVGKGQIVSEGAEAVFRGRFFGTTRGREARELALEMGDAMRWSYSFFISDAKPATGIWKEQGAKRILAKITPFEVSPVTLAAGGNSTRTVSAKCAGCGGSCGCGSRSTNAPDPAAVAQVVADAQRTIARHAAFTDALREPQGRLALAIADRATRWLTGGTMQRPPVVRFFPPNGQYRGFYDPGEPSTIYITRGLTDLELIRVVGHEISHWLRPWDRDETVAIADAESVTRRYLDTLEA